jgi:two-component system nitrogen regulation response regulator NtrX
MSTPRILVVDDEADIRTLVQEILAEEGYDVATAGNAAAARSARAAQRPDLVLLDIWMPDVDGITLLKEWAREDGGAGAVVMMSGHGTVDTAIEATRLGALDFIEKPLSLAKLLRTVQNALEKSRLGGARRARTSAASMLEPIGRSRVVQAQREQVRKIAQQDTPVLFAGEPGTGRETLARFLHAMSPRAAAPFVMVVAGALRDADAAAKLFGDADGPGLLEQATGGTLFLNELGDMSAEVQRLLGAMLEGKSFSRVGSAQPIPFAARLVSSAAADIVARVDRGEFRRDLFNQLDVVQLRIPPLREYREDVPDLLRYYVDLLVDAEGLKYRRFSVAAQNRLRNYPWPGNVREVKNIVHRLLALGGGDEVSLEEVEGVIAREAQPEREPLVKQDLLALPLREAREAFERAYLEQQLELAGGRVGKLAERVGMERTHLYRKLKQLGIEIGGEKDED